MHVPKIPSVVQARYSVIAVIEYPLCLIMAGIALPKSAYSMKMAERTVRAAPTFLLANSIIIRIRNTPIMISESVAPVIALFTIMGDDILMT